MIFGNMGEMMKMAREMQTKLKKVKNELSREIYDGSSQGVMVKVSGEMEVKEVNINLQQCKDLEKAVKEAANKALKSAKDAAAKKMKGVTGGMGLPGLPGM
jgi:DNA-binding YbaB/EbfC family protein